MVGGRVPSFVEEQHFPGSISGKNRTNTANHIFASVYAFFKLELMKIRLNLNHYVMKAVLVTVRWFDLAGQ